MITIDDTLCRVSYQINNKISKEIFIVNSTNNSSKTHFERCLNLDKRYLNYKVYFISFMLLHLKTDQFTVYDT